MPDFANATVQTPLREGGRRLGDPETIDLMVWHRQMWEFERRLILGMMVEEVEGFARLMQATTPPFLPPVLRLGKRRVSDG